MHLRGSSTSTLWAYKKEAIPLEWALFTVLESFFIGVIHLWRHKLLSLFCLLTPYSHIFYPSVINFPNFLTSHLQNDDVIYEWEHPWHKSKVAASNHYFTTCISMDAFCHLKGDGGAIIKPATSLVPPYPSVIYHWKIKFETFLKNQVGRTWSLLIFTACVACKNLVWNRLKIKFSQLDIYEKSFKLQFQNIKYRWIGCM